MRNIHLIDAYDDGQGQEAYDLEFYFTTVSYSESGSDLFDVFAWIKANDTVGGFLGPFGSTAVNYKSMEIKASDFSNDRTIYLDEDLTKTGYVQIFAQEGSDAASADFEYGSDQTTTEIFLNWSAHRNEEISNTLTISNDTEFYIDVKSQYQQISANGSNMPIIPPGGSALFHTYWDDYEGRRFLQYCG